jgi:DNA transformation protein
MSTSVSTIDYIVDQLISLDGVTTRKMFGEYALYHDGKVVGLICDNTLFIKITEDGKNFVDKDYKEGFPYPGAKAWMQINEDRIEDRMWLCELVQTTADALPLPKPKKKPVKK